MDDDRGAASNLDQRRVFVINITLTGGGKLMNRITKPAIIRNTSRKMIIPQSQAGNRLQYDNDTTNEPTSNLSAIGSKNDPSLLACDAQFRAMKPSN